MSYKPWCADRATFRYYVYPDTSLAGFSEGLQLRSEQMDALLSVLRSTRYVTTDPAEACLFFPVLDTLCTFNKCVVPEGAVARALYELPYWNNGMLVMYACYACYYCAICNVGARRAGKDHVLFNFMDSDFVANIGAAILVKSSFGPRLNLPELVAHVNNTAARDNEHYRPGYDVMFPLAFYRCGFHPETHLRNFDNVTLLAPHVRAS